LSFSLLLGGVAQKAKIPPPAVGGWVKCFLKTEAVLSSMNPCTAVQGSFKSALFICKIKFQPRNQADANKYDPQTAVWAIPAVVMLDLL
jgi:hypothetical protein